MTRLNISLADFLRRYTEVAQLSHDNPIYLAFDYENGRADCLIRLVSVDFESDWAVLHYYYEATHPECQDVVIEPSGMKAHVEQQWTIDEDIVIEHVFRGRNLEASPLDMSRFVPIIMIT